MRDWQAGGVWGAAHRALLDRLGSADRVAWERGCLDGASIPAKGGAGTGRNPTDRGKPAVKLRLPTDANGVPVAARVGPANRHDSNAFEAMLDAVPPIHVPRGGRRKRPAKRHADKRYVCRRRRDACRKRRIKHGIARDGVEPKGRLSRHRRVLKRTLAWLKRYRGLAVRHERRADIYQAFLTPACCLVGHKHLPHDEF